MRKKFIRTDKEMNQQEMSLESPVRDTERPVLCGVDGLIAPVFIQCFDQVRQAGIGDSLTDRCFYADTVA